MRQTPHRLHLIFWPKRMPFRFIVYMVLTAYFVTAAVSIAGQKSLPNSALSVRNSVMERLLDNALSRFDLSPKIPCCTAAFLSKTGHARVQINLSAAKLSSLIDLPRLFTVKVRRALFPLGAIKTSIIGGTGLAITFLAFWFAQRLGYSSRRARQRSNLPALGMPEWNIRSINAFDVRTRQARLDRIEAIANFGSYELGFSQDGRQQTSCWSTQMYKLLGLDPSSRPVPTDEYMEKWIHADDRARARTIIERAFAENHSVELEYRITCPDGHIKYLHDIVDFNSEDAAGRRTFFGLLYDVSEAKLAQAELQHARQDLQDMIAKLDVLRENEQKRLAQEMHDDLGQLLVAMKLDLFALQQGLPPDDTRLIGQLASLEELVDVGITSVRRIVADLPPKVLEELDLFNALELLVANFRKRHRIVAKIATPKPRPVLNECLAKPIYRMTQEALNNIAKHAQATEVEVLIVCRDNHLVLRISDNGIGIPADNLYRTRTFGLIGMRERASALGGEMSIESISHVGTTIQITVPTECSCSVPHNCHIS